MHLHQADQITADTSTAPQVKPRYKRRVVMLKPLVDTPPMFDKPLKTLRLLRNNSDSSSSPDFSPTSVLPYDKHRHTDLKAGQSQLHQALAAPSCYLPADSPPNTPSPTVTSCQQPASTESWTTRHFVYDVKSAAQPAPAAASVRQIPTKASTAVAALPGPAAQPAKQAVHAKRGTLETAWRWRFKRQWGRVQAQALISDLHDPADDQSDDPWHMAFDMIQAGTAFPDVGVPLPDHDCYSDGPAASPLLDADDDMDGLFEFEHDSAESVGSDRLGPRPALAEAASKARQLIKHQASLDQYHQQMHLKTTQDQAPFPYLLSHHKTPAQGQAPGWNIKGMLNTDTSSPQKGEGRPVGMHTSISGHMLAAAMPRRSDSAASLAI